MNGVMKNVFTFVANSNIIIFMNTKKITDTHNIIIEILNNAELTNSELTTVLAQLLIYSGQAITKKDIDIYNMNLEYLNREYYINNQDNDIGLGLILNGASIMGAISEQISGNETAIQGESHGNSVSTSN